MTKENECVIKHIIEISQKIIVNNCLILTLV